VPRDSLALVYVGQKIFNDKSQKEYIKREIKSIGYKVVMEISKETFDSEILDLILSIFPRANILLAVSNDKSPLVGRVLSTLLGDNLSLKGEILMPSDPKDSSDFSYTVEYLHSNINVLSIKRGKKLPHILLKPPVKERYLLLLDNESDISMLKAKIYKNPLINLNFTVERYFELDVYSRKEILSFGHFLKKITLKAIKKDSILKAIIEYLSAKNMKITFAESCTGGALANRFISFSGASAIIDGSFVTYSNEIKSSWLGVNENTLIKFGAVSRECVYEMAEGARRKAKADIAIAISGIAGPGGAVEGKPVGTVYICIKSDSKEVIKRLNLDGDRVYIQQKSVDWAIYLLILAFGDDFFDFFSKRS